MSQRQAVIITALPIERAAVLEHLHSVNEEPPLRGSIYRRGIFDERSESWDVIVAEIGAGNEGAAAEAERIISHYSPQVALFVGVAGAIKDVRHGDIVASTKIYAYESGKDQVGGFKPRPSIQLPAYMLEQRARYEAGEQSWLMRIKGQPLSEKAVSPAAKVGPIAAGEKVIASNHSQLFRFIRKNYGDALAVEMEGHGFLLGVHMNHPTQGMVIRSISDCVSDKDETNDEDWQPVAARHAAAFAFQVLAKLSHGEEEARRSEQQANPDIQQRDAGQKLDYSSYLRSISDRYQCWWQTYTPTDATVQCSTDFDLMVTTVSKGKQEDKRLPVIAGIQKCLAEHTHVLLVGRPGSGKSTAMIRLLLELSKQTSVAQPSTIPLLIELRHWQSTAIDRILASITKHDPAIVINDQLCSKLLRRGRFILLFDGVNELPSDEARTKLASFRSDHPQVQMVFTTRDLGAADALGIQSVLKMDALSDAQIATFVNSHIPNAGNAVLREIREHDLLDFCRAPLLLWMLCEVCSRTPDYKIHSLASILRHFVELYESSSVRKYESAPLKGDVHPLSDRRLWQPAMKHLGSTMTHGQSRVELDLTISRSEAEQNLRNIFQNERYPVRDILDDLLKYHLLHKSDIARIEFHHQQIQEYFAAEALAQSLPHISDEQLRDTYLNYIKWTEPIKMVAAISDSVSQRERLVRLAGEIDENLKEEIRLSIPAPDGTIRQIESETRGGHTSSDESSHLSRFESGIQILLQTAIEEALAALGDTEESEMKTDSVMNLLRELDESEEKIANQQRPNSDDLQSSRDAIERLDGVRHHLVTRRLVTLVQSGTYIAKRHAALQLMNCAQHYREGSSPGWRTPQEYFVIPRDNAENLYSPQLAIVGWLGLLADPHPDIRADSVKYYTRMPITISLPSLILLLQDDAMFHDHGEDRSKEYVSGNAFKCLLDAIENASTDEVAPYLVHLKKMLPIVSTKAPWGSSSSHDKVQRVMFAIQSRCRYYDYEHHKRMP